MQANKTKMDTARRDNILRILGETYPDAKPELYFRTPFELLIATILSAQCTDRQVNRVTEVLFKQYNTPTALAALTSDELELIIKPCGFFKTKSRNIIATSKLLLERHGGEVPPDRDTLMELPGVGRKTANVVVSNAFGIPAIAVDTHVFRVSNRIGLASAKDVEETEEQLMEVVPMEKWSHTHHLLIFHGRRCCYARNPACSTCAIGEYCDHTGLTDKP